MNDKKISNKEKEIFIIVLGIIIILFLVFFFSDKEQITNNSTSEYYYYEDEIEIRDIKCLDDYDGDGYLNCIITIIDRHNNLAIGEFECKSSYEVK